MSQYETIYESSLLDNLTVNIEWNYDVRLTKKELLSSDLDVYESTVFMLQLFMDGFPAYSNSRDFWLLNLWMSEILGEVNPLDAIDLMERKRKDYGDLPFRISGTIGVMARTADKVCRLERLLQSQEPNFESVQDTYQDWFNYSLVALDMIVKEN